ncbi:MAG: hypothetical protein PSV35_04735 [bacterium]|nr:hypothetical protein [bacterium]
MFKWMWLAAVFFLVSCKSIGPQILNNDRYHYNEAMSYSNNQELLLNMVRLRYNESTMAIGVGNISGSTSLQKGGNLAGFIPFPPLKGFAGPSLGINPNINYTDNPIVTYIPLDTQKFTQSFLSTLSLADIGLLLQSSWSIPRVMRVGLQRVGNAYNAPSSARPTSSHVPQYQNFIDMTYVLRRMQIDDALTGFYQKKDTVEELILVIRPDYRLTANEKRVLRKAGVEIYNHKIIFTNRPAPHKVFEITRSMLGILNYLSKGMDTPAEDVSRNILTQTVYANGGVFDWQNVLRGMMRIHFSTTPPNDAYISIIYRGRWYYIKDSDTDSKETLMLLSNMSGLIQDSSIDNSLVPALTRAV